MTTPSILVFSNFSLLNEVECDVTDRGIRAVLMQKWQPIALFSKALSDGNLPKLIYKKEFMALVLAIQHWKHYTMGKKFLVYTDRKSLK